MNIPVFPVGEAVFTDMPVMKDRSEYDSCLKEIVLRLSALEDVYSIISVGEVSSPGFSDVDFFIILKDEMKSPKKVMSVVESLLRDFPYLLIHYPHVIPKFLAPKLLYLFPLFNYDTVYGPKIDFEKPDELVKLGMLVDYVINFVPHEFVRYVVKKEIILKNKLFSYVMNTFLSHSGLLRFVNGRHVIPVRNLLCRLNSVKYELNLIENFISVPDEFKETSKRVSRLREKWFGMDDSDRKKELLDLTTQTIKTGFWVARQTGRILSDYTTGNKKGFELLREYILVFGQNGLSDEELYYAMLDGYKQTGEIISYLPVELYDQKQMKDVYAQGEKPDYLFMEPYNQLMKKRYTYFKQQIDFLNRYSFYFKLIISSDVLNAKPILYKLYKQFAYPLRKLKMKKYLRHTERIGGGETA